MSGRVNTMFDHHEDKVNWCEFSPDGTTILSCSSDKTLKVCEHSFTNIKPYSLYYFEAS